MDFEYDPAKSAANKAKHGVDFKEAQRLWDSRRLEFDIVRNHGEPRFGVVGLLDGKHWTAIATMRDDRVRLISVRRARKDEEELYNGEANKH